MEHMKSYWAGSSSTTPWSPDRSALSQLLSLLLHPHWILLSLYYTDDGSQGEGWSGWDITLQQLWESKISSWFFRVILSSSSAGRGRKKETCTLLLCQCKKSQQCILAWIWNGWCGRGGHGNYLLTSQLGLYRLCHPLMSVLTGGWSASSSKLHFTFGTKQGQNGVPNWRLFWWIPHGCLLATLLCAVWASDGCRCWSIAEALLLWEPHCLGAHNWIPTGFCNGR